MTSEKSWQPVTTSVHVFVAPVDRETDTGTVFDPTSALAFDLSNPPSPWLALGEVENFQRTANDEMTQVASGSEAAVVAQFRKRLEARVSFEFRHWGRLQLAMASGGMHWNVLEPAPGATPAAVGGEAIPAVRLQVGSTAQCLKLPAGVAGRFAAGDLVVVDDDFQQQSGYVGLGNSGGYVSSESEIRPGVDYVRRVSSNLARIAAISGDDLLLETPLPAGDPPLTASVQNVIAIVEREGGVFRQEWSALFVEGTVTGGKVFYYYPRLQSVPPAMEHLAPIAGDYKALLLRAHLLALPTSDPQDGAAALWYRAYVPPVVAGS
jgi:hypothetical protein